jgi:transposase InsO family protein
MSTSGFCRLFDIPERTWRRRQANARDGGVPGLGAWPAPVRRNDAIVAAVIRNARRHPVWGHRKVWALTRFDGIEVSQSSVLRIMREQGWLLPAAYQRERRDLAGQRKAAFANVPIRADEVWQLDFSEYETTTGGVWRIAGCRDYYSKWEYPAQLSPTANRHDAIAAVQLALDEYARIRGHALLDAAERDPDGNIIPFTTIVTDNGGPFRSFEFQAFLSTHPELRHVRTRVKSPGQNGSRERGFGTMKYEHLFLHEIDSALDLQFHLEQWRKEYNLDRPHEAIAWNRPTDVHLHGASPNTPLFENV